MNIQYSICKPSNRLRESLRRFDALGVVPTVRGKNRQAVILNEVKDLK